MTTVAGTKNSRFPYPQTRQSTDPRNAGRARLPLAVAGIAAIGMAGLIAAAQPRGAEVPTVGTVRGEFRLAPGNQQPPGVAIPLDGQGAVPGEFRLGVGNAMPPGVVVPVR